MFNQFLLLSSLVSISFSFPFRSAVANVSARRGMDHGEISSLHENAAKEFVSKYMETDGVLDKAKLREFLKRLKKEREELKHDLYETEILERVTLFANKPGKAKEKALAEIEGKTNLLLRGYDEYLIPKIEELILLVESHQKPDEWYGIVDDFIRGYISYFVPNAQRKIWSQDDDLLLVGKHILVPLKVKKNDASKVESFNLMVDASNHDEIVKCLKVDVKNGHYLSQIELARLDSCGFDLSRLNPGVSALWKEVDEEELGGIRSTNFDLFPSEGDRLKFEKVRINGKGSSKLTVSFKRGGKKEKIKIKVGDEVHSDIVASKLGQFIGLNQDHMLFRKKVRIHLDGTSYDSFAAEFSAKNGDESLSRFVTAHGSDEEGDWILMRDVHFETRPEDEWRLAPFDPGAWDLQNRREYRSLFLFYAWLAIEDAKAGNFLALFQQSPDGLVPLHRIQDLGFSLGSGLYARKPKQLFAMLAPFKVNDFDTVVAERADRGEHKKIKIWWNDFKFRKRNYSLATWNDLKWMARQIAAVRDQDITHALEISGMPQEIIELYRHKIVLRRNSIVKAFDLDDEVPKLEAPDLDHYSPNPAVKNGKVVQTAFPDTNAMIYSPRKFTSVLAESLNLKLPLLTLSRKFKENYNQVAASLDWKTPAGLDLKVGFDRKFWDAGSGTAKNGSLGGGVILGFSRQVEINKQLLNSEGKGRPFVVTDSLSLNVSANTALSKKLLEKLPIHASAGVKLYTKVFEHKHYAENLKDAFTKPFLLFQAMFDLKTFVSEHLDVLDMVSLYDRYGFEFEGEVNPLSIRYLFSNSFTTKSGIVHSTPLYFVRDQFGALHIYREKTTKLYTGLGADLAAIDLVSIPLVGLDFTFSRFFHEEVDYTFQLPEYDINKSSMIRQQFFRLEKEALERFLESHSEDELVGLMHRNFQFKADISRRNHASSLLYYFGHGKTTSKADAHVVLNGGEEHKFHRRAVDKRTYRGATFIKIPSQTDLLTKRARRMRVVLEIDHKEPDHFVLMALAEHFHRKLSQEEVLNFVQKLNERFSESESSPFYRNFTLPPVDEVKEYRKLYASSRIYIKGKALLELIREKDFVEIAHEVRAHYEVGTINRSCPRGEVEKFCGDMVRYAKFLKIRQIYERIKGLVSKPEKDQDIRAIADLAEQLIYKLYIDKYGMKILANLLGTENIFVLGDISGIFISFSNLQDLQPMATRRFAGKSWGGFEFVSPIQYFLRYGKFIRPSFYISPEVDEEDIFGQIPTGTAPLR